jgi:hypothetical protein
VGAEGSGKNSQFGDHRLLSYPHFPQKIHHGSYQYFYDSGEDERPERAQIWLVIARTDVLPWYDVSSFF